MKIDMSHIPKDIQLALPSRSNLPREKQHFLVYIPWRESYLEMVPKEYRAFFKFIHPYLKFRTTDVHTAICASFIDRFVSNFSQNVNKRVVTISLLLHDTGWSQLAEEEIAASLGVTGLQLTSTAKGPKEKHALESEKIARKVLADFIFEPALTKDEVDLISKSVLYHDKPEQVAGSDQPVPIEVQILVDLDHLWSFTHENFWQDTIRKGIEPAVYLENLNRDLDSYFVTEPGKHLARELWEKRKLEVVNLIS